MLADLGRIVLAGGVVVVDGGVDGAVVV